MSMAWALAQASDGQRGPRWIWPEQSTLPLRPLLWAATVLVGLGLLAWFSRLVLRWWRRLAPIRLFWSLGGRLGLSHAQRWWLWGVSRRAGLASPITLLACPSTLRVYAEAHTDRHGRHRSAAREALRVNGVIARLHGPASASVTGKSG